MKELLGFILPMQKTQKALGVLRNMELSLERYEFRKVQGMIMIPIVREPSAQQDSILRKELGSFQIQQVAFADSVSRPKNLQETVAGQIPSHLISMLPHSFDVIGDIAIIDLRSELAPYAVEIGNGIRRVNPNVRLVVRKSGEVSGKFRTRELQILAGSGGMETVHREFSCSYHLDISSVYFNPRLAHERLRVAKQVRENEVVVDMFAGVGPYSVLIAKLQPTSRVYSIDINPSAIRYLEANTFGNRVADCVAPLLGDARKLSKLKVRGIADRVIMNLPSEAGNYIDAALRTLKTEGGIVHFYQFTQRDTIVDSVKDSFKSSVVGMNREVKSFNFCKAIREIAPGKVQVAIDAAVT
ncbi:MAG: class I SAM-dependent methyltransferase family protein [Candidatus Bathyarchaeia archaeon]